MTNSFLSGPAAAQTLPIVVTSPSLLDDETKKFQLEPGVQKIHLTQPEKVLFYLGIINSKAFNAVTTSNSGVSSKTSGTSATAISDTHPAPLVTEYKIEIHLDHPDIDLQLLGVYLLKDRDHARIETTVIHNAPSCKSRISVKGALEGSSSQFYWSGDVFIGERAIGTDTYEENRNLLLNLGPKVTSIPNLEILTGDIIAAGHASATGQLNEEHIFYLMSRGLDYQSVRKMVISGFLNDQVEAIGSPAITDKFKETIYE
ncbi:MAG: SufD family Fe-S cluster assembly protein [Bifidobacteriaceae bacterium]|jgi:hypothetical protein|nr:SufD family Fe-S cluster assembly protein [Bifidobacteriaceae bacterium]